MEDNKNLSENERVRLENKAAFKNMNRQQKLDYFKAYYMVPTLAVLFGIFLVIYVIVTTLTPEPEISFMLMTTGCMFTEEGEADLVSEMTTRLGVGEENLYIDDGHDYQRDALVLMTHLSASEVDILLMEEENFESMVNSGAFIDLRTVFDEETLAAWEPYLVWTAGAPMDLENSDEEPREACPYGIRLGGTDWLAGHCIGEDVVMGLTYNTRGTDNGVSFISWVMDQ